MGLLDSIIPKRPQRQDLLQADLDLQQYRDEQQALSQKATIEESVERRVREEMAKVKKDEPEAKNLSPFDTWDRISPSAQGDAIPSDTGLTYTTLDMISRVPVVHAVLATRVYQVLEFTQRQRHKKMTGYRVEMRDHARAPTEAALKRIAEIEAWFETCGDPTQQEDPSFSTFTQKIMWDSLRFDQACAEILLDKYKRPAAMLPVDARTIRRAQPTNKEIERLQIDRRKGFFIQKDEKGEVHNTWDSDHFLFGIRRHRSDIQARGYGYPELEVLARTVNYLLQAEFFNAANFTNGVNAAGLLIFKTAMDRGQFQQLDQRMRQVLAGAHNAHRMAFLQLNPETNEMAQHIPFNQNNRDMEFSLWISWLLKIICGEFMMDPAEVQFIYGSENQKAVLNQQDPTDRIIQSKERGLRPILTAYEGWLNRAIVWRLDPDFVIKFVGLDSRSPLVQSQLDTQSMKWEPTNQIRARHDMPPLDHWVYDYPADPVTLSIIAQERQMLMQQQMQQQAAAQQQQEQPQEGQQPQDTGMPPEELPPEYVQPEAFIDAMYGNDDDTPEYGDIDFNAIESPGRRMLPPGMEMVSKGMGIKKKSVTVEG